MGIHALPVFVSTTVDFASFGRAKLIKWSHSCSHLSFENQLALHKIDSTHKTALRLVGIAVMPTLVKERGVWGRPKTGWGRWLNYHGSGSNQICFFDTKRLHELQGILEKLSHKNLPNITPQQSYGFRFNLKTCKCGTKKSRDKFFDAFEKGLQLHTVTWTWHEKVQIVPVVPYNQILPSPLCLFQFSRQTSPPKFQFQMNAVKGKEAFQFTAWDLPSCTCLQLETSS